MPAKKAYLFLSVVFPLFFAIWSMYTGVYRVAAGLTPLQLVLLGTTLELSILLAEVPTGIVADIYSRKYSIIIGVFITGIGLFLEGLWPWVVTIFIAQALWGIGHTFMSGARDAWLAGEIGEENLGDMLLLGSQVGRISSLFGMGIALGLALLETVRTPLMIGGIGMIVVSIVLPFIMPETGFAPANMADRSTFGQMRETLQQGLKIVRQSPILMLMFLATLFIGLGSEGIDRFWEVHLLQNFTFPELVTDLSFSGANLITTASGDSFQDFGANVTLWFFIINFVSTLIGLLVTRIVRKRIDVNHNHTAMRYLLFANFIIIAGILVFGATRSIEAAIASWFVIRSFRWTAGPIISAVLNRHIRQDVRATVLSMRGQADAIGQTISGPLMGLIATVGSLRIAFFAVAIIMAPILLIYRRVLREVSQE